MAKDYELTTYTNLTEVKEIYDELLTLDGAAKDAENALNNLKLKNAEKLKEVMLSNLSAINKQRMADEQRNFEFSQSLIKKGFSNNAVINSQNALEKKQALLKLNKQEKEELKGKTKEEQKIIKAKYDLIRKNEDLSQKSVKDSIKKLDKESRKAFKARLKDENKARLEAIQEEVEAAKKEYGKAGGLVGTVKGLKNLKASGATRGQVAGTALSAGMEALQSYAQSLEATMKEVALTKTLIDTRLQGSKRSKTALGSY